MRMRIRAIIPIGRNRKNPFELQTSGPFVVHENDLLSIKQNCFLDVPIFCQISYFGLDTLRKTLRILIKKQICRIQNIRGNF